MHTIRQFIRFIGPAALCLNMVGTMAGAADKPPSPAHVTILVGAGDAVREQVVNEDEIDPVKAFGVRSSAPIPTGLAILEGKVIKPPYVVKRRGLEILINDTVAKPAKQWPLDKDPDVREDPGNPPATLPGIAVDRDTPEDERMADAWWSYWGKKYYWLKRQMGQKKAIAEWARLVAKHPDIVKAEPSPDDDGDVLIVTKSKDKWTFPLDEPRKRVTAADRARDVQADFDRYVRMLRDDALVLQYKALTWAGIQPQIWASLHVALSDLPEAKRWDVLTRLGAISNVDETPQGLSNFEKQLWREIGQIPVDAATRAEIQRRAGNAGQ